MAEKIRVLCLVKDQEMAEDVEWILNEEGYGLVAVKNLEQAQPILRGMKGGYIITSEDISMFPECEKLPAFYQMAAPFTIFGKTNWEAV